MILSKPSQKVESRLQNNETHWHIQNDLNRPSTGVQIVGPETVIYAEVNDKITSNTYAEVQDYLAHVDASDVTSPCNSLYATVDETNTQEQRLNADGEDVAGVTLATHESNAQIDGTAMSNSNNEPNKEPPGPMAVYAVVDKSKKSKKVNKQKDLEAMYAQVDKSRKTKKVHIQKNIK